MRKMKSEITFVLRLVLILFVCKMYEDEKNEK